mmetsp:Transcript_43965/g.125886  ORF Transcript_43965/g.125886 Transcript_43965/m.125886 type:complete len:413 (-) Transcript_43965:167-1405(-)
MRAGHQEERKGMRSSSSAARAKERGHTGGDRKGNPLYSTGTRFGCRQLASRTPPRRWSPRDPSHLDDVIQSGLGWIVDNVLRDSQRSALLGLNAHHRVVRARLEGQARPQAVAVVPGEARVRGPLGPGVPEPHMAHQDEAPAAETAGALPEACSGVLVALERAVRKINALSEHPRMLREPEPVAHDRQGRLPRRAVKQKPSADTKLLGAPDTIHVHHPQPEVVLVGPVRLAGVEIVDDLRVLGGPGLHLRDAWPLLYSAQPYRLPHHPVHRHEEQGNADLICDQRVHGGREDHRSGRNSESEDGAGNSARLPQHHRGADSQGSVADNGQLLFEGQAHQGEGHDEQPRGRGSHGAALQRHGGSQGAPVVEHQQATEGHQQASDQQRRVVCLAGQVLHHLGGGDRRSRQHQEAD